MPRPVSTLVLSLCLLWSGCGRNPMRQVVRRLSGSETERKQATMELLVSSEDAVPALLDCAGDRNASIRLRAGCIAVLGNVANRQDDERAYKFLVAALSGDEPRLRLAAVEAFANHGYDPAIEALVALKHKTTDPDALRLIDRAVAACARAVAADIRNLWTVPEKAEEAYAVARERGLDRGLVGYQAACYDESRGELQRAAEQYDKLGVIRHWWLLGTFPNIQDRGFRTVYEPERSLDLDAAYQASGRTIRWYKPPRPIPYGRVNFEDYFVDVDQVAAYAVCLIEAQRETEAEVRAGSDDTLAAWLNGENVWFYEEFRGVTFDDDVIPVTLRPGINTLLVKVCEGYGDWGLLARITSPGDTPLEGVRILSERP